MPRLLFSFVLLTLCTPVFGQTTLYVDDDGCPNPGTGTQVDPLCRIRRAIELANAGDEITVAPGTYNELINFFGKAVTLRSSNGPEVTIIDAGPVIDSGAGKPVVRCDNGEGADTVLDGFTLTGGTGKATKTDRTLGGGMFNFNTSPTVTNCIFTGNTATDGGGMYNFNSSPTVTGCMFKGNTASGDGGGMADLDNSDPIVTQCIFDNNSAGLYGGGMANHDNSDPKVISCTFSANVAERGAGIASLSNYLSVAQCTFTGNISSEKGGGMYNYKNDTLVTDCIFDNNTAYFAGGGIFNQANNAIVTNGIFVANRTTGPISAGGAIMNGGTTTLANCIFSGNSVSTNPPDCSTNCADGDGGAIDNAGILAVISSTFSANYAAFGGGINDDGGSASLNNCVFYDNADALSTSFSAQILAGSGTRIAFSNIEGSGGSANWDSSFGTSIDGGGNIDADPLFVDADGKDGIVGTVDDDLRLLAGSPAIDAGFSFGTLFDLDGNVRIVNDPATPDSGVGFPKVIDMGAYEFGSSPTAGLTDLDGDGDVDINDYALFLATFTGPTIP